MTLPGPRYPSLPELLAIPETLGGRVTTIGESIKGRPIRCFEHGPSSAPTVLLTALMDGLEIVGGLGLIASAQALLKLSPTTPLRLSTLHDVARGTTALIERALTAARVPILSSPNHRGVA